MASSKEIQHSSRPLGQQRLSMTSNPGSLPRQSHARTHSHSVSLGSHNSNNRVTRRKSVSSNASNVAALVAAARESGDTTLGIPITNRRKSMTKGSRFNIGSLPSPPPDLSSHKIKLSATNGKADRGESAIDDEMDEDMDDEDVNSFDQLRTRRASEGSHLIKDGKKSSGGELKCDKCGKGYKHSSCLTKHLWEHTPEWSLTSKLLISKHQQVQLLEAASILVNLNQDGTTPPDSAKDFQSDQESASPAASGTSDQHDRLSSADTTPPPQADMFSKSALSSSYSNRHKRNSSGYGFSRSYQSAPLSSHQSGSVPTSSFFGHQRVPSRERRPFSSGISSNNEDEGLAAALGMLSSSFRSNGSNGTPRIPATLPEDAPPVPDIPAHYLSQDVYSNAFSGTKLAQTESYTRGTRADKQADRDVKMEESEGSNADDEEYDHRSRGRSDDDDDGVFGRMEE